MGTSSSDCSRLCLELLPTELLFIVTDFLFNADLKSLSLVCRKLREASLPHIFRKVRFQFSHSGFNALRELLRSELRHHVVVFTYVIPELLHPETQNLTYFKHNVLKPEHHEEVYNDANTYYDFDKANGSYMLIYDTFKSISQEQHAIVESCEDLTSLSNAFRGLPRLNELCLEFCPTLDETAWLAFYMDRTIAESTVRHHLQVISIALKTGRDSGIFIRTVHLSNFEHSLIPSSLQDSKSKFLTVHLRELLKCASNLRLSGSGSPLKLLACIDLNIEQLELCQLTVPQVDLHEFMQNNASSIISVGYHEVRLIAPSPAHSSLVKLSPKLCDSLLKLDIPTIFMSASTSCLVCLKEGWALSNEYI